MNDRFRLTNCAHILVLSILLRSFSSHCYQDLLFKDTSSVAADDGHVASEQQGELDPSIERIFRGAGEKGTVDTEPGPEPSKVPAAAEGRRGRAKRESALKRSSKPKARPNLEVPSGAGKKETKRSPASKMKDAAAEASRSGRSSQEFAKPRERSAEDEGQARLAGRPRQEAGYGGEDTERFIEQEERSSLYDDFEAKDVAKRGAAGADDYEEMESEGSVEDVAALEEREEAEETAERRKDRGGDAERVKRERASAKEADGERIENRRAASDDSKVVAEPPMSGAGTEGGRSGKASVAGGEPWTSDDGDRTDQQAKLDAAARPSSALERTEVEGNGDAASLKLEATGEDGKARDANGLAEETPGDASSPNAEPRQAVEPAKLQAAANALGGEQLADEDYEKRVEEQIQRKIDSIKEEIKREIAQSQRLREIEENNARYDELEEQDDDAEQEEADDAPSSKRSPRDTGHRRRASAAVVEVEDASRRKKRQGESEPREARRTARRAASSPRKRSAPRASQQLAAPALSELPKKREYPRQVYLVRRDRNAAKKRRRRRSRNGPRLPYPEQRAVQLEESPPADLALGSISELVPAAGGKQSVATKITEDEKAGLAGQDSLAGTKAGSVASLTDSDSKEEMGPLATEYGDAFGGLQGGEPGVALARFKRIKRVLRPPASKS